jgi:hypothetical protein
MLRKLEQFIESFDGVVQEREFDVTFRNGRMDEYGYVMNLMDAGNTLIADSAGIKASWIIRDICKSISENFDPKEFSYYIFSRYPQGYAVVGNSPNCRGNLSSYERETGGVLIDELSSTAVQRGTGRENQPAMVLTIDDLSGLNSLYQDQSFRDNMKTLLTRGPNKNIWTIASVGARDSSTIKRELEGYFTSGIGW